MGTHENPGRGIRRFALSGIRMRLLVSFVLLLALATAGSVIVVRAILIHRLDERIDAEIVQEGRELQQLARGNDPDTGTPFAGRVRRIFEVFLARNIPSRYEAQLTFVDGDPYLRSRRVVPYRLDKDAALVDRWASVERSDRGRIDTPAGPVEFLALPLQAEGETEGVFVVAIFRDIAMAEVAPAIAGAAGVGIIVLLFGSILAWRVADRILGPVARVTALARGISETDLRRRIDVSEKDEIGRLVHTLNEMLDRLEKAFSAQRRFVDDAGHELRTPITIIQGQLDVLGDDPEDRRRTLEVVMDELDRMSRFVNDLLLLARAERPDFLNLDTLDVEKLTDEMQRKASSLGPRRWRVDALGRGRIVGDRQRLTQAVMQLAQNATQHTDEGDEIGLGSAVQDGEARFWVRDTGRGIAPEEHDRIFDRFGRGGRSRDQGDGAGLGLSIVQAIATAHHGRVELESGLGEGSTFTLVLPVDQPIVSEGDG
jgi:signal transduction histidine kinase